MICVSTALALIASLVFFVGTLFESGLTATAEIFNVCDNQIRICKISSIVFVVLYWFAVSGLPQAECLAGYAKLSAVCFTIGRIWIIFAFVNVVFSMFLGILKRGGSELAIMGKLRTSCFIMGAVFLVIAFLLKVN